MLHRLVREDCAPGCEHVCSKSREGSAIHCNGIIDDQHCVYVAETRSRTSGDTPEENELQYPVCRQAVGKRVVKTALLHTSWCPQIKSQLERWGSACGKRR